MARHVGGVGVACAAEVDMGHIAQPEDLAIGGGAQDDIAKLIGRGEAATGGEGELECLG